MQCPQCQNVLPDSAQFCPGCGYRFPVQTTQGAPYPPSAPPAGGTYAPPPAAGPYAPPPGAGAPPYAVPGAPPSGYGYPPGAAPSPYGVPGPVPGSPYGVPGPMPGSPYGAPGLPPAGGPPPRSVDEICQTGYTLEIGKWIGDGWQIVKPVLWPMVGYQVLTSFISNMSGGASMLVYGPLMAGLFLVPLRTLKGRPQSFGAFFDGFKAFLPLFLLSIVSGLLIMSGFLLLILPGIYLGTAYMWAQLLVIDRGMDFWPAMSASMKVVNRNFWGSLGFMLITGLLSMLGLLACCVGMLFTTPWVIGIQIAAYRDIFGLNAGPDRCETQPNPF
ncbi:MAG TPA: zinc-ribbon domain-containing protein [Polyangia bacterium]|jgi:hypothetical protein